MPLLGNKLHILNAIAKKHKKNLDEVVPIECFVVPETKEICSSAEELNRKKIIYESKVWSCRVTGRSNLTYMEANKSEHTSGNVLKKSIDSHYRTFILNIVHSSNLALEPLVNLCWSNIQDQFVIDEPVLLKVDTNKPIHATILDIHRDQVEPEVIDLSNDTNSPNHSDKENNAVIKKSPAIKQTFSYSVRLSSDDPVVVNHVPASSIQRLHRAPSKEHIRMFIKANSMRYGPSCTGPWIVDTGALRKYCPNIKSTVNIVDKKKVRQMSEAYEERYYVRVMNERSQNCLENGDSTVKKTPMSLKKLKHFSVLRGDNATDKKDKITSPNKAKLNSNISGKKMKQVRLSFGKTNDEQRSPKKTLKKNGTPTKLEVVLPAIAKKLVRFIRSQVEEKPSTMMLTRCVNELTAKQIAALPEDVQALLAERRSMIAKRNSLKNMTPEERETHLRNRRIERQHKNRKIVDENEKQLLLDLPCPRPFPIPSNISDLQFSRILSFTEFIYAHQSLLTDGALSAGEAVQSNRLRQLATDLCANEDETKEGGADETFLSEDEEEAALSAAAGGLPKASINGLRKLSLDRVLMAVAEDNMSCAAYRCITRPMAALIRIVFMDAQVSEKKELGIQISKLPVTPYTAPEILRLLLANELADGIASTRDWAVSRIQSLCGDDSTDTSITAEPKSDMQGARSLIEHLSTMDVYSLDAEHRILLIELLVEWLLAIDLIDDHMISTSTKSAKATQAFNVLNKKKTKLQPATTITTSVSGTALSSLDKETDTVDGEGDGEEALEAEDLASIVKRRRILAAQAASERETRDLLEKERREAEALICTEQRVITKAQQEAQAASINAKIARRIVPLGMDRQDRRYWHFFCSPSRLFVEENWAPLCSSTYHVDQPTDCNVPMSTDIDNCVISSFPSECNLPMFHPALSTAARECATNIGYASHSRWSVLDTEAELDHLFASLMDRGFREKGLRRVLGNNGLLANIKELISIVHQKQERKSSSTTAPDLAVEKPKKSSDEKTIDKITAKCRGDARAILVHVLIKNVYETEIHLRDGGLGGVPDFAEWQAKILSIQSHYDLIFSVTRDFPSPKRSLSNNPDPSTICNGLEALAQILLDVGHNIHRRYLDVPKCINKSIVFIKKDENEQNEGKKEEEEDKFDDKAEEEMQTTEFSLIKKKDSDVVRWITAWSDAVKSASTLARLNFLHTCLDSCIVWEKSVENARCRICRRKSDDENLLLCDGCNQGFHLYCLRPILKCIPRGDWFCVSCRPKRNVRSHREKQRTRNDKSSSSCSEDSSDDDDNDDDSDEDDDSVKSNEEDEEFNEYVWVQEKKRCLRALKTKKSQSLPKVASTSSLNSTSFSDTLCLVCNEPSDALIPCSACPNAFHADCHSPALRAAQRKAAWHCSVCKMNQFKSLHSALRPRGVKNTRVGRRNAYFSLHRMTTAPQKRPRPSSDSDSVEESESEAEEKDDDNFDEEDEDDVNDGATEETEGQEQDDDDEASADEKEDGHRLMTRRGSVKPPPAKRARTSESNKQAFTCADIVSAIRRHKKSWPFQDPVDRDEVPDYYDIIVEPIDLSIIDKRVRSDRYNGKEGPEKLRDDLKLMFFNAELYNSADSDIWESGAQLEAYVQTLFKKLPTPVVYKREKLN